MGDKIRKICYAVFLVIFLSLGIIGIFYTPDETKNNKKDNNSIIVSCTNTKDVLIEGTETIDYTEEVATNIVISKNSITGRMVNEKITYKDQTSYTNRKEKLISSGANYTFDDNTLSYTYKRSLESKELENVKADKESVENHFKNLGYTCN